MTVRSMKLPDRCTSDIYDTHSKRYIGILTRILEYIEIVIDYL